MTPTFLNQEPRLKQAPGIQRRGLCNTCGQCCRVIALPHKETMPQDKDHYYFILGREHPDEERMLTFRENLQFAYSKDNSLIMIKAPKGGSQIRALGNLHPVAIIQSICKYLEGDKCQLYGNPDRPQTCNNSPTFPYELETIPHPSECGFEFSELQAADYKTATFSVESEIAHG